MFILGSLATALRELWLLVGHIQSSSFPQPFSAEKEREYLKKQEAGERIQNINYNMGTHRMSPGNVPDSGG